MNWPTEIMDAFAEGMDVDPIDGKTKTDVIQCLLDETARCAVWRVNASSLDLETAYITPVTPIGYVSTIGVINGDLPANSITLTAGWGAAVACLNEFIVKNPDLICDHFKDQQKWYDEDAD